MKPHLPATLRRALLAALAIATLTPSARADLTLGSDDTLIIDYAADSTLPPPDADGGLTLTGDTKLQLNNCGTGDGKTYTIITGVSGLVDKDGNALTDYAASVYFDTTQPGTGFWAAGTLQLEGNELQLVLHSESVKVHETFTTRQVNPSSYNYYKSISFESRSGSNSGGAIYGYSSTITLSNNGSISFSGNKTDFDGGAICGYDNTTITLSNNGCVSFNGNTADGSGGAIYGGTNASITLSNNGSISFSGNTADDSGGAIYGGTNASITLSNNGSISFIGNTADDSGGAIFGYSNTITLRNNGSVSFSGNKTDFDGGAICGYDNTTITLSNNDSISFSGNTADDYGGAIYGNDRVSITLSNNGSVSFSGNTADYYGGAIYGYDNTTITLSNNGSVSFTDNTASQRGGAIYGYSSTITLSNNGSISFTDNTASDRGGAIYGYDDASITLSNNGSISFSGNTAVFDGGAIFGYDNTSITLSNNDSISFSGNQARYGGAIYTVHSLSIRNNKTVEFRSNVEGANNTYRLRSIYQTGDTATSHLSAPAEGSITFYDSVYIKGNLELNAAFNHDDDATTPVLAQTGTITFDGSTAEADLNAYFEKNDIQDEQGNIRKATQDEILASRTSTLEGSTTLHAGTLEVVGGAILEVKNSLTVKEGASFTVQNGSKLTATGGGKLNNAGTITLNGETVLDSAISNSGTLTLSGTINVQTGQYLQADAEYILYSEKLGDAGSLTGNGFASDQSIYTIIKKNGTPTINDSATWTVDGAAAVFSQTDTAGTLTVTSTQNTSIYWVNNGEVKISKAAYNFVTDTANGSLTKSIAMNGGSLVMDEALNGVKIRRDKTSTIEIADGVDLSANEMTGTAEVTLAGEGSYTLETAANTLDESVTLGAGWSGTVKTSGDTSALELDTLDVSGTKVDLGSNTHILATRDQSVTADVKSSGTVKLEQHKLTLSGSNELGALSVRSLDIAGGSTALSAGLTTTDESSVKDGATLSLAGESSIGGKITLGSGSTLTLDGSITVNKDSFAPEDAVVDVVGYFIGNSTKPHDTLSGFMAACWDITVAEGGTIEDKGVTWKLEGDENADFKFEADGTLHAYGSGVDTIFRVAAGDTITYAEANAADFVNSQDQAATGISLNGGTLKLETELRDASADYVKSTAASTIEIADGVDLSAAQLDASAADVTLAGKGSYSMESAANTLGDGVSVGAGWSGTVYTGSITSGMDLNVNAMGNAHSTVYLGARPMRRAGGSETVLEKLTASDVGTTTVPGSLTLQKGESTTRNLHVQGALTLGTAASSASLNATGTVTLQGLRFGHAESSMQAQTLTGVTTLDVQMSDAALSAAALGKTYTLVTLDNAFDGDVLLNGQDATEGLRSADNRRDFTLNWNTDGTILTLTILGTESYVTEQVNPTTYNGLAGVALVTDVFLNDKPAAGGALEAILQAVDAGTATDRDMAAVAGASTATLGMAMAGDVERQLRAIRNRSVSDAWGQDSVALDGKGGSLTQPGKFFAWVNAEGNRSEQEADGTAAGYTLNSWGGTVGAGMQVNDQLTLGVALTAMYGDLKSDGPDTLNGDMDTTYLSAFSRYSSGAWSHALIGTMGSMEADYKRHAVGYATKGDTDGTAFGLMYELSHRFEMNEKSSISPVFNIAYRHTKVDSYSESGSDAALSVGEQSLDTVTVGAGARYAAVVGEQSLNRPCNVEARALLKYDFGDTQSDTSVGFINHATRANIESADLGAFGVELGAGISVPVGDGRIFADGAVELRSGYTNYNATIGYGIRF